MSRRHMLKDVLGMSYADLEAMYHQLGTVEAVSERLGMSERTIKYWFKEGGIEGIQHITRKHPLNVQNQLKQWIVANPGAKLPRSQVKIAAITGISRAVVVTYLVRRKKRLLRWIAAQPALTEVNATLRAVDRSYVPTKAILWYEIDIDQYDLRITVKGERINGTSFEVKLTVRDYGKLVTAGSTSRPS